MFGKCIVCGIKSDRTHCDFICDGCLEPDKIILVCKNCRRKIELSLEDVMKLNQYSKVQIPLHTGVVLQESHCELCSKTYKRENSVITIYKLKSKDLN